MARRFHQQWCDLGPVAAQVVGMRLAWLPWMFTLQTVAAPLQAGHAFEPIRIEVLMHPSRRRVRADVRRLAQFRRVA